eukprot:769385-Prorocentrum_minimum.AAC.1
MLRKKVIGVTKQRDDLSASLLAEGTTVAALQQYLNRLREELSEAKQATKHLGNEVGPVLSLL